MNFDKRYIDTYLAGKNEIVKADILNVLEYSMDINTDIVTLYLIDKKKLKFSYKVITISKWGKYVDVFLLGHYTISIRLEYNNFLKFQRNIKIEKILSN
jgi:hypothetical protein